MFKVLKSGKSKSKSWKRMVSKATFVGEGFTRKPVKMERFVRPMALRYKKANVTHRKCPVPFRISCLDVCGPRDSRHIVKGCLAFLESLHRR